MNNKEANRSPVMLQAQDHNEERRPDSRGALRLIKLRQRDDENAKLGFSLRGGKEATGSSVGVFVSHVEPMGRAHRLGLRCGDQLIQVNGLQVSDATYDEVIELIKRTPRCDHIALLVNYVGRVPVQTRAGEPIGWLELDGGQDTAKCDGSATAVVSAASEPADLANNDGDRRRAHHRQHQPQSQPYSSSPLAPEARDMRHESCMTSSCTSSAASYDYEDDDDEEGDSLEMGGKQLPSSSSSSVGSTSSGCSLSLSSVQSASSSTDSSSTNTITGHREGADSDGTTLIRVPGGRQTSEPFGCGVVKGPAEWPGIFVQNVKRHSLAERVGLAPGDQLVRAEQRELAELAFEEAISLIKQLQTQQDELVLQVRKGAALKHLAKCKMRQQQQQQHQAAAPALPADNGARSDNRAKDLGDGAAEGKVVAAAAAAAAATTPDGQPKIRLIVRRKPLEAPPAPPTRHHHHLKQVPADGESEHKKLGRVTTAQTATGGDSGACCGRLAADSISAQKSLEANHSDGAESIEEEMSHSAASDLEQQQRQQQQRRQWIASAENLQTLQRTGAALGRADEEAPSCTGGHSISCANLAQAESGCAAQRAGASARLLSSATKQERAEQSGKLKCQATRRGDAPAADHDDEERRDSSSQTNERAEQPRRSKGISTSPSRQTVTANYKAADNDHADDGDENGQSGCEHEEEEIRIVRQNCKLHHNSRQTLIKSRMLIQQQQQHHQQQLQAQQLVKGCRHYQQTTRCATTGKQRALRKDLKGQLVRLRPLNGQLCPAEAPLQRHVSVDNLNLIGPAQICQMPARVARPPASTRPSSVLGPANTTLPSANLPLCCPSSSRKRNYLQPVQQHQLDCCLMLQTAHHLGQVVRPIATTLKNAGTAGGATTSSSKLLRQQQQRCSSTLALAKFKARSEDKLNLMSMNVNYVQIGQFGAKSTRDLLRLQQARHQQQEARLRARDSLEWPHDSDCRRPLPMLPSCCRKQQQQQQQQQQRQQQQLLGMARLQQQSRALMRAQLRAATSPVVFNYATATGMISHKRKVSPAIDHRFVALETIDSIQPDRQPKPVRPVTSDRFAHACCCCPIALVSDQQHLVKAAAEANRKVSAGSGGGAATDSSGYQSSSERRNSANSSIDSTHNSSRCKTGVTNSDCCRRAPARPTRSSAANEHQHAKQRKPQLSTFGPAQPAPNSNRLLAGDQIQVPPPAIELGNSCGVGSISSAAGSSASSSLSSPFSCSPLSSPSGHHYLSPSSSPPSATVNMARATLATTTNAAHCEPLVSRPKDQRLVKRKTGPTRAINEQRGVPIPHPPPLPLDDLTLRQPAKARLESAASSGVGGAMQAPMAASKRQESCTGASNHAMAGQKSMAASGGNKLCFVDELKMLASQTSATLVKAASGTQTDNFQDDQPIGPSRQRAERQGDSSTLIKLINANKAAAAAAIAAKSDGRRGSVECGCCKASERSAGQACRKFATKTALERQSGPPKSVQLRDEEDNKRRQHELLMEEFKTAHSKMFNRLRKTSNDTNNNSNIEGRQHQHHQHQQQTAKDYKLAAARELGGHDDDGPEAKSSSSALGKISSDNAANKVTTRPRPALVMN